MEMEDNTVFSAWINEKDGIVSFERVDGYERIVFPSNEEKLKFVVEKGSSGFRIQ